MFLLLCVNNHNCVARNFGTEHRELAICFESSSSIPVYGRIVFFPFPEGKERLMLQWQGRAYSLPKENVWLVGSCVTYYCRFYFESRQIGYSKNLASYASVHSVQDYEFIQNVQKLVQLPSASRSEQDVAGALPATTRRRPQKKNPTKNRTRCSDRCWWSHFTEFDSGMCISTRIWGSARIYPRERYSFHDSSYQNEISS